MTHVCGMQAMWPATSERAGRGFITRQKQVVYLAFAFSVSYAFTPKLSGILCRQPRLRPLR